MNELEVLNDINNKLSELINIASLILFINMLSFFVNWARRILQRVKRGFNISE